MMELCLQETHASTSGTQDAYCHRHTGFASGHTASPRLLALCSNNCSLGLSERDNMEPSEVGQTSGNHKQGGWTAFPFIIGTVLGLSLAAGWASNLMVFLISEFNVKSITATQISNVILGCNNLFPIAGAIIADSFLGSFSIISIFALVSLLGMAMLTLLASVKSLSPQPCAIGSSTCETPSKHQLGVLYTTLALASLGIGGTRFTIATMGADQFDKPSDQGIFFNWYFLAFYIAGAISFTAIIYIEDNIGWGLGFGICLIANAIGLIIFLLGKRFYRLVRPKGSPFASIARVVVAAIRKRKMIGTFESQDYYYETTGMLKMQSTAPTKSFRFLNRAALKIEADNRSDISYARSWMQCTVEEVEDLKTLVKIIPLWSTGILLSTSIGMFNSLTVLQALTMDRHLGPNFKIPAASFLVFNLLATTISIFIIDRFLLPTWKNLIQQSLTPLQCIGLGHIINIAGMVASALLETRRLHLVRTHQPTSALWLLVPLATVGVGESFHFPGQVALYYQEFPRSLRSTSTAMISLLIGIGFYMSTVVTDSVRRTTGWLPDNINDGRLDNVFWMLAVAGGVNLGYYLICAKLFKYQNFENHGGALVSR